MLRCQFLCHVLKALFFIKIAQKLSYICKKMQNLRPLGAPPPNPRASGGWGLIPQTPKTAPIANFWLRAWHMVSTRNHPSIVLFFNNNSYIHLHLASFYAQNTLKKNISHGKCWLNKLLNFRGGGLGPWPNMHFYNRLFSWQNKNL